MFSALKHALQYPITPAQLSTNILAGLTVGVIALPLSMALAIATGVAPQHGLYTAIVAGIVTAIFGGSRLNISGPTAAFVVILLPIVQRYGLGGLLTSGMLAGCLLLAMGLAKLGRFFEIIPYPVVIGFTAGIGVVIATLQLNDFLGLNIAALHGHYLEKLQQIIAALPHTQWQECCVGFSTLIVIIGWSKINKNIPSHLVGLLFATLVVVALNSIMPSLQVSTIGSRFNFNLNGIIGYGIPPILPSFDWPWQYSPIPGHEGGLSFGLINTLLGAAITIAILGALESLLCAMVADSMSGEKHNPNQELIGQGLANIITPFFGGIPSTAAMARTAANVKAGGRHAISPIVHSLFIIVAIMAIAPLLAHIPMAAMAALLLVVAWNMSEAKHFITVLKTAPRDDIIILLTCFSLTVLFDMTIAVAMGLGVAAILFIQRSIQSSRTHQAEKMLDAVGENQATYPDYIKIYHIEGPLFFGSASKTFTQLSQLVPGIRTLIIDMSKVTLLDLSAMVALKNCIGELDKQQLHLIINNLDAHMLKQLKRAGLTRAQGEVHFTVSMDNAIELAQILATSTQSNTSQAVM